MGLIVNKIAVNTVGVAASTGELHFATVRRKLSNVNNSLIWMITENFIDMNCLISL